MRSSSSLIIFISFLILFWGESSLVFSSDIFLIIDIENINKIDNKETFKISFLSLRFDSDNKLKNFDYLQFSFHRYLYFLRLNSRLSFTSNKRIQLL